MADVMHEFCLASVDVLAQAFLKWNDAVRKELGDYLSPEQIAAMDITELSFMQAKDLMFFILKDIPVPSISDLKNNDSQTEGAGEKLPASPA